MEPHVLTSAIEAAIATASALGLGVEDAIVVSNANRVAVRLVPCDVLARVVAHEPDRPAAEFEVAIAQWLAGTDSPVVPLETRVKPGVYPHGEFVVTFWTYYEPVAPRDLAPGEYAHALRRMHAGMREIDPPAPHFTDRVAEAQRQLGDRHLTPELGGADRHLLRATLDSMLRVVGHRGAPEQLLHGEPHAGNVLRTKDGLLFVDLETCCRGPVEFDIAHVPAEVGERYPGLDQDLVHACRILMLAMVTTWRWRRHDRHPDGRRLAKDWLSEMLAELDRWGPRLLRSDGGAA